MSGSNNQEDSDFETYFANRFRGLVQAGLDASNETTTEGSGAADSATNTMNAGHAGHASSNMGFPDNPNPNEQILDAQGHEPISEEFWNDFFTDQEIDQLFGEDVGQGSSGGNCPANPIHRAPIDNLDPQLMVGEPAADQTHIIHDAVSVHQYSGLFPYEPNSADQVMQEVHQEDQTVPTVIENQMPPPPNTPPFEHPYLPVFHGQGESRSHHADHPPPPPTTPQYPSNNSFSNHTFAAHFTKNVYYPPHGESASEAPNPRHEAPYYPQPNNQYTAAGPSHGPYYNHPSSAYGTTPNPASNEPHIGIYDNQPNSPYLPSGSTTTDRASIDRHTSTSASPQTQNAHITYRGTKPNAIPCLECHKNFLPTARSSLRCGRCHTKWIRHTRGPPHYGLDNEVQTFDDAQARIFPITQGLRIPNDDVPRYAHEEDAVLRRFIDAINRVYPASDPEDGNGNGEGGSGSGSVDGGNPIAIVTTRPNTHESNEAGPSNAPDSSDPQPWNSFYARQQTFFNKKGFSNAQVLTGLRMLYRALLILHCGGQSVFPTGGDNAGYSTRDTVSKFSTRCAMIEAIFRRNKRVVSDVVEGRGVCAFVQDPFAFERRKTDNETSNLKKKTLHKMGKMVLQRADLTPARAGGVLGGAGGDGETQATGSASGGRRLKRDVGEAGFDGD